MLVNKKHIGFIVLVLLSIFSFSKPITISSNFKLYQNFKDTPILDTIVVLNNTDSVVVLQTVEPKIFLGTASFYHDKFVGRKTSSGAIFSQKKYTAAHRTLPLGTKVKVTNLANSKTVFVTINDRMGKSNHVIDLTFAAATDLNFVAKGWTKVSIEIVKK